MLSPEFVLAGHAIFTVANPAGTHYTFRVCGKPDRNRPDAEIHFAAVLTGRDNEEDYTYAGIVRDDLSVAFTAKSGFAADSQPARVLTWALRRIAAGTEPPPGYSIEHAGKCGRCGRTLTTPESLARGLGPECATKA